MGLSLREQAKKLAEKKKNGNPKSPAPLNQEKLIADDDEPVAYFQPEKGSYFRRMDNGDYVRQSEAAVRRILKYRTYGHVTDKEANYRLCDRHLIKLQEEHYVEYAGPLAGFMAGLHDIAGTRVLVTKSPELIQWKPGKWPLLAKFFDQLFGESKPIIFAWLKASLRVLYAGIHPFRPAPMLALVGAGGGGKSFFQNLVTEMLGKRSAKPYRYLIGDTGFNSDLFGAEHLMIEDDATETDLRFRRAFGNNLKNLVFNETQSFHKKAMDAFTVSVFSRVTITLNEEPENLAVLPPLDESLLDKITIVRTHKATFPYGMDDIVGRKKYREAVSAELPSFIAWLKSWKVPARLMDKRSGVLAIQDKEIVQRLFLLAPEAALMDLIDRLQIWEAGDDLWSGSAGQLKERLVEKDKTNSADSLLRYGNSCGTYLGRAMKQYPKRIAARHAREVNSVWYIARIGKKIVVPDDLKKEPWVEEDTGTR